MFIQMSHLNLCTSVVSTFTRASALQEPIVPRRVRETRVLEPRCGVAQADHGALLPCCGVARAARRGDHGALLSRHCVA